jgi:hypothetical protein
MRAAITIAIVVLLGAGALGAASAQAAAKPCMPRGTKTVEKRSGSRVFDRSGRGAYGPFTATYACRYATGSVFKLGVEWTEDLNSGPIADIELAGPYVSWTHQFSDEFEDITDLFLLNLATGRRLSVDVTDSPDGPDVDDTALTPSGSLAWIDAVPNAKGTRVREVWSLVGKTRTKLDSVPDGPDAPIVLSLEGTTLSWESNGQTKQAPLP